MEARSNLILIAALIVILSARCTYADPTNKVATGEMDSSNLASPNDASANPDNTNFLENAREHATNAWKRVQEDATNAWASAKQGGMEAWSNAKESLGAVRNYSYDQKNQFVTDAQADTDKLDAKIAALSGRIASLSEATKTNAQARLQGLRDQRAVLDQRLAKVKNATQANWDDAKVAFKKSYEDLKKSLKRTWTWLQDKTG